MSVILDVAGYHRPVDMNQAIDLLVRYGERAEVIAGGTDILPQRPGGKKRGNGKHLVDITHLGLAYIREEDGGIRIGAATTVNSLCNSGLFSVEPYAVLPVAAGRHSTVTVRNRATIGGNLCTASAGADLALPLLVLDARLVATGPNGDREIPIEDFFKGANVSALLDGEILREIHLPCFLGESGTSFLKLVRQQTAIDMAIVNVAARLSLSGDRCRIARIGLGAVGPVPFRPKEAEAILEGRIPNHEVIQQAAIAAAEASAPIDDFRATANYRKKMTSLLVRRSLEGSLERSPGRRRE